MGAVWRRNALSRFPRLSWSPHAQVSLPKIAWPTALVAASAVSATLALSGATTSAHAASSDACEGGGFSLVNKTTGAVVAAGEVDAAIEAARFGRSVRGARPLQHLRGPHAGLRACSTTPSPAPRPEDITGGRRTPVFASKVPDHRGLDAQQRASRSSIDDEDLVIRAPAPGLSMKIQAKDCAQGGIFQMEPERGDGTAHPDRAHPRDPAPALTAVLLRQPELPRPRRAVPRSRLHQRRDRPAGPVLRAGQHPHQHRQRLLPQVRRPRQRPGGRAGPAGRLQHRHPVTPSVEHCGGVSVWDVASGGRMGFVTGEDAVEVANPPTDCVEHCQAQNQVRGRLAVLGFPFPVPAGSRLAPASRPCRCRR